MSFTALAEAYAESASLRNSWSKWFFWKREFSNCWLDRVGLAKGGAGTAAGAGVLYRQGREETLLGSQRQQGPRRKYSLPGSLGSRGTVALF